jgi:site-specific DNA recombinase
MMMQLKGVFAEYEKHKIRERTSRGRREKIEQKFVPSGRAAYGYRYKGKAEGSRGEWVIVPEQAAVVRRIFRMAERGMGALEIARKLEADGIPTATGARWNKAVVSAILRNTAYYGSALFNRHYLCEPRRRRKAPVAGQSKKTSTGLRDQSEWIEVPVPAIIDKALFDRVRAAVERSAAARVGRPTQAYLLSGLGLLKCGLCGRALYAYPNRGRSFYRCGHIDRLTNRRLCDGRSVWVRELETAIWDKTVETLSDADELRRQVAAHDHARIKAQKDGAKRRAALEREIFKLRQREQRTAKDLLDAELESVHAAIRAGIKATAAQRRAAERELQALTPQSLEGRFAGLDLEGLCRDFRKAAKDATPEQKRKILSAWVREIRVWGHGDAFEFEMKVERPVAMLPEKQRPASVDATNWKYQQSVAGSLGGAR